MPDLNFHRKARHSSVSPAKHSLKRICSANTPDLFHTTPGPLICKATRGATRVDDDDDDDDANDAVAADDDDSALSFSE